MSYTVIPDKNIFIEQISNILATSALLFPNSIGGNSGVQDLVNQIVEYESPVPNYPQTGAGPPYIFVTTSKNPIYSKKPIGRNNLDQQGPQRWTLEFWIYIVVNGPDLMTSESQMYDILSALTTTLDLNKRLLNTEGSPTCIISDYTEVDVAIETDSRTMLAKNVIFRPDVLVNLRTS
jgi:hypothetical protein